MKPPVFHLRPSAPRRHRLVREDTKEAWEFPDHAAALDHVAAHGESERAVVYLEDEAGQRLFAVFV